MCVHENYFIDLSDVEFYILHWAALRRLLLLVILAFNSNLLVFRLLLFSNLVFLVFFVEFKQLFDRGTLVYWRRQVRKRIS